VITDSQSIRDDCERGIYCSTGRKDTAVHDVKVIEFVGFAVHVERTGLGISSEPDCSILMGYSGKWNSLANESIPRKETLGDSHGHARDICFAVAARI
jgi:hypothetical protein